MILTVTANASIDKRYLMAKFDIGEVNRVKECNMVAGGKGLNVSHAAHIAGEEVIATGFLGGHHGRFVQEKLREEGIIDDFVWCNGETRSCVNIWNEELRQQTELLEPGLTVTEEDKEALVEKFRKLIRKAEVADISGSLPGGADSSLYKKLIEVAKEEGKKIVLDTSGKTLLECIHFAPYMVKPNIDEIKQLVGRRLDPSNHKEIFDAAAELRAMGIKVVVVSLGSAGALMSCESGNFVAKVPKIDAVNTVGCGDAMTGGFCVGLSRGLKAEECLRLASAISAASAMTEVTGYFRIEDMKDILPKVEITKAD